LRAVDLLLRSNYCQYDKKDDNNQTPIGQALMSNDYESLKFMLNIENEKEKE
jgi:hypothetical protein